MALPPNLTSVEKTRIISALEDTDGHGRHLPAFRATRSGIRAPARTRARALRAPIQRPALRSAYNAPGAFRAEPRAALDAAVDQDGRLSRGLRLLPAGGTLSHGCREPGAARARRRAARGEDGSESRCHALLHGRGVARPQ